MAKNYHHEPSKFFGYAFIALTISALVSIFLGLALEGAGLWFIAIPAVICVAVIAAAAYKFLITRVSYDSLHDAIIDGNAKHVKNILRDGADINIKNEQGIPLHLAVQNGHLKIIKLLLESGADSYALDDKGFTAFNYRNIKDDETVALLEAHCPCNYISVVQAVINNDADAIERFHESGADLNAVNANDLTLLGEAITNNANDAFDKLLALGADPKRLVLSGCMNLFHFAVQSKNQHAVEALQPLLQSPFDEKTTTSKTALHIAAAQADPDLNILAILLDKSDPHVRTTADNTPYMLTKNAGAKSLICQKSFGYRSIHDAVKAGDLAAVTTAIETCGVSIDEQSASGDTPLLVAVTASQLEITNYLLNKNPNINLKNDKGYTPLIAATCQNNARLVNILLGRGADADHATEAGEIPLLMALRKNYDKCIKLLIRHTTNFDTSDEYGVPISTYFQGRGNAGYRKLRDKRIKEIAEQRKKAAKQAQKVEKAVKEPVASSKKQRKKKNGP